jgi:hypothetical protein
MSYQRHPSRSKDGGQLGGGGGGEILDPTQIDPESAVKVAVAVRPILDLEKGLKGGSTDIVTIVPPGSIKLPRKPDGSGTEDCYPFEFEKVLRINNIAASKELFGTMVLPVVERFCQGFNTTVAAYGQTGSGKTYTMGTSLSLTDFMAPDPKGIVPRVVAVIMSYIKAASKTYDIVLKATYVEIYNEQVVDLLAEPTEQQGVPSREPSYGINKSRPGSTLGPTGGKDRPIVSSGAIPTKVPSRVAEKLEIHEKESGEVYVEGAVEIKVSSREEVAKVLDRGNSLRTVASHKMNSESSRSHAIITLLMEQRVRPEYAHKVPKEVKFLRSKFNLVDLAGSERAKDTQASGDRFAEGVNINKGLLELGNCINALTEGKSRRHVPYRNSKLTRLLQDSLGGNSETLFIACISPAAKNLDTSLNTLRYASRARAIRNNLRLNNKMSPEEEIEYLKGIIQQLQRENGGLKERLNSAGLL